MIKIPQTNYTQNNKSDTLGTLWATFNCDFSTNKGKLRLSPRSVITTDDISNLGVAVGFVRFNAGTAGFYTLAGDRVFNTSSVDPSIAFVDSATGNSGGSTNTSDIIHFKAANMLVVSQGGSSSSVIYYNGSWNSTSSASLQGGTPQMLCEFDQRLYVTKYYKTITSFDTSMTVAPGATNTFTLGTLDANNVGLRIVDILSASDGIWILTQTQQSGEPAFIYKWDGTTANTPDLTFQLDTSGVMCGVVKDDTLYILTAEGELMYNNGGTFTRAENGRLPVNPDKYLKNSFSAVNDRWIHPRGITITDEGKINILINNEYEDGTIEERLPSGIWEFDLSNPSLGWVHIGSLSLYSSTVQDYGQIRVARVGALKYVKTPGKNGTYLVGAQLYTNASTTKEVILTNNTADTVQKSGYIVTQKIYSQSITEEWQKAYARFRKFLDANDKITVKYRVSESTAAEGAIQWVDTNVLQTSVSFTHEVGDEVEITQGLGGGKTAHVTAVETVGSVYFLTLDETFTGVTSGLTGKARFQKWKKVGTYSGQTKDFEEFSPLDQGTWIQFKIALQFTGKGELNDLLLISRPHQ